MLLVGYPRESHRMRPVTQRPAVWSSLIGSFVGGGGPMNIALALMIVVIGSSSYYGREGLILRRLAI